MRTNNMSFAAVKPRSGFTLIEVMVVIAIIGLLSSIIISNLQQARRKAEDAKTLTEFRQIDTAMELYASNNNGKYPYANMSANPSFICVSNTTCTLVGISPNTKIANIPIGSIDTPIIAGTNNYQSRGFSYVPTSACDTSGCTKGQALIMAPTYNGLLCQTVGIWEKPFSCTRLPE